MQKGPKRIRRCRSCGAKTHQRFWEDEKCPVCRSSRGYSLSAHGGLHSHNIKKQREALLVTKK